MTKKNSAVMRQSIVLIALTAAASLAAQQPPNPRQQPGALVHIYAPEQHDLYDGHFVISANRIYMVGGLNDPEGWDHLDNDAKNVGFLAGWGYGHATLNGKPLYQDYEMHFMVTQGLRDRKTLRVNYPLAT